MFGEAVINVATWLVLDKETYHRINNVTLPLADGGSTQIDHIIVSKFGIFVIETKNYKGWIYGSEKQSQWTQTLGGKKYKFQNPLRQNYLHIKTLADLLALELSYFHTMIVFIGDCELKTRDELPEYVLTGGMINYIKSKQDKILTEEQVATIVEQIEKGRFTKSWRTNAKHKAYLKEKHNLPSTVNKPQVTAKKPTFKAAPSDLRVDKEEVVYLTPFDIEPIVDVEIANSATTATATTTVTTVTTVTNAFSATDTMPQASEITQPMTELVSSQTCAKCGKDMVKRVAQKGARQGQAFWGCSGFPKCRNVVNIVSEEPV